MTKIGDAIRQGDVLLVRVAALPKNVRRKEPTNRRLIVEYGEATGHAHVFDPEKVEGYDILSEAGAIVGQAFKVLEDTPLQHDEHDPHPFERDTIWERWYQVEDTGEEERRVRD